MLNWEAHKGTVSTVAWVLGWTCVVCIGIAAFFGVAELFRMGWESLSYGWQWGVGLTGAFLTFYALCYVCVLEQLDSDKLTDEQRKEQLKNQMEV